MGTHLKCVNERVHDVSANIAERIRQARLASSMTLNEVALQLAQLGQPITRAALSKYEHGKSAPRAPLLLTLAQALNVKPSYFLTERLEPMDVEWLAFRRDPQLPVKRQMQIKAVAHTIAERQHELQSLLYPNISIGLPPRRPIRAFADAEIAAQELRQVWRLGLAPIESVTQAIEDHGGIVIGWAADEGQFDGLAAWINGVTPLVVMNTSAQPDRRRFSLSHELAHLLDIRTDTPNAQEEPLAHRFAGAFLVPAEVARQELGAKRRHVSLEELGLLKTKYGLSMQAWAHRALDLNIIDDGLYSRLRAEVVERGGVVREPVLCEAPEEPLRLRQMTLRALAEGVITEERARELCPEAVTKRPAPQPMGRAYTARDLARFPREERDRILAEMAQAAEMEYGADTELTDFETFGEGDLHDEYPD